jgi:hypothetical protein
MNQYFTNKNQGQKPIPRSPKNLRIRTTPANLAKRLDPSHAKDRRIKQK